VARISKFVAVGVALLALAACGSSRTSRAAATPNPTAFTATFTNYMSNLNAPLKSFADAWHSYQQDCVIAHEDLACRVTPRTLNATSKTILAVILGSKQLGSDQEVSVPDELAPVLDTMTEYAMRVEADTEEASESKDDLNHDGFMLWMDVYSWGCLTQQGRTA
jgi:hypothetical protein